MAWTEERVALLTEYWDKGHTASQIAELLGEGLSRNAVIGKAHRLGLPARPSPLKSRKAPAKPRKAKKAPDTVAAAPEAAAAPVPEKAARKDAPAAKAPAPSQTEAQESPAKDNGGAPLAKAPKEPVVEQAAKAPVAPARPVARPAKKRRNSKVTLLDLNDRICRWPIGHPDEADFHFCGKPVNPGFPYCAEHCLEAYQAQMPHRDRQGGAPRSQQHGHTGGAQAGSAANSQAEPQTSR